MNDFERLQNGMELFGKIAITQVEWRMANGGAGIEPNNDALWGGLLHRMSNDDWFDVLTAFPIIVRHYGVFLKDYQDKGYEHCAKTLSDHWDTPRCLDIKNKRLDNKKIQWRMIMIIREVYETINNIKYPKVPQKTTVTKPQFDSLFE